MLMPLANKVVFFSCVALSVIMPSAVFAQDVSLDSFLQKVLEHSDEIRAIDLDVQSLKAEIRSRDLELSPSLNLALTRFWDDRPNFSTNPQTSGFVSEMLLSKPFATGTSVNLLSALETVDYQAPDNEENLMSWQLGVTQSLWQNRFGRQTDLRRQRDDQELQSRLLVLMKQRQDILVEFESLYWDIAYARYEVKVQEENFQRSRQILDWIQDRYDRSAAEHVDLLQGQALVARRQLEQQLAIDHFRTLQARLKEKLALDAEILPQYEDLEKERSVDDLPVRAEFAPADPVLIEALQAQAESEFLGKKAELEADRLKPELDIGYTYGQQGLSASFSAARNQVFSDNMDYHEVGFVFSVPLDIFLIRQSREAGRLAAMAQQARSVKFSRQSEIQWQDLKRTIQEQKQRVETARTLAKFQQEKSQEERARYEKGKSTAFQAITFEQEAAESELLLLQLLAQLRRTEAQARVFIQKGGDL